MVVSLPLKILKLKVFPQLFYVIRPYKFESRCAISKHTSSLTYFLGKRYIRLETQISTPFFYTVDKTTLNVHKCLSAL